MAYRLFGVSLPALERNFLSGRPGAGVRKVWCYFNNDAAIAAIPNAHTLIRLTSASMKIF
jgi:hypothetical protein